MGQQQFKCNGDCLKCHQNQRQYCACQFTYNSMRMIERMQGEIDVIKHKIEAIQGNEASLFDPTMVDEEITQSGDGVSE